MYFPIDLTIHLGKKQSSRSTEGYPPLSFQVGSFSFRFQAAAFRFSLSLRTPPKTASSSVARLTRLRPAHRSVRDRGEAHG